jgi:nicotinamidase-related amidase
MEQNKQNTALLVMDMQAAILRNFPKTGKFITNVTKVIENARANNIPVLYIVVGYRPGMPELNRNNKNYAAARERFASINVEEWMKIHPDLLPLANEIIITKRRISAFSGSDLEIILRAFGIQHMVLTGIATSGVVLSTVREAADKDYRLTVLSDCCADADQEVHRVLTTKVFPRQADVLTADEWLSS